MQRSDSVTVAIARPKHVHVEIAVKSIDEAQRHLGVPAKELEARLRRRVDGRVKVVPGPIDVADVEIHQHVVDVVRHVEQIGVDRVGRAVGIVPLHLLKRGERRHRVRAGEALQRVPEGQIRG